jgi:hypothetical protein
MLSAGLSTVETGTVLQIGNRRVLQALYWNACNVFSFFRIRSLDGISLFSEAKPGTPK